MPSVPLISIIDGSDSKGTTSCIAESSNGSSDPIAVETPLVAQQTQCSNPEPTMVPQIPNSAEKEDEIAKKKADWEKWQQRKAAKEANRKKKADLRKKRE